MRRQEPEAETFADLGSEARSVLAVLLMASLWPERYPDGWVSVGDFARAGVLLGDRADRESLKAAIRRGLRGLAGQPEVPAIHHQRTRDLDRSTGRTLRERDRRLGSGLSRELDHWLRSEGRSYVPPDLWREFTSASPTFENPGSFQGMLLLVSRSLRSAGRTWAPGSVERATLRRVILVVHEEIKNAGDDPSEGQGQ